jgi:hypothetical protein
VSDRGVLICGWHYQTPSEVSADKTRGDAFALIVGVRMTE